MPGLVNKFRKWLQKFVGLHPACVLENSDFYNDIAQALLYIPRVFGSKDRLVIGQNVVLNDALINTSSGNVIINDFAFLGHGVSLLTGTHNYYARNFDRQTAIPPCGRDIVIGKGAWLGSRVTVLGPCEIGDHAVVAAGSVVLENVDSGCVYAGVPARKIKIIETENVC